jgi:hypothetical protein
MDRQRANATVPVSEPAGAGFRLSRELWGLDWNRVLPVRLTDDGVSVHVGTFESASRFVTAHYAELFDEQGDGPFATDMGGAAKARYYALAGDFFELRDDGRMIGLLVCDPRDWSTYYIRSGAVLRSLEGRRLLPAFLARVVFEELKRVGVERVECDTSPANLVMMHTMGRLRFNVTGTCLSERWGACVHFTKFLNDGNERTFLQQFCSGVKYQLRRSGGDDRRRNEDVP